jgi:hypothetical protein
MTQKAVEIYKKKNNLDSSCQTLTQSLIKMYRKNNLDASCQTDLIHLNLTKNKIISMYYSKCYSGKVLCFKNGKSSKPFIISKSMWYEFRKYLAKIDRIFLEIEK